MSDARAQELLRQVGQGDPTARVALFKHLARTADPDLSAAVDLRQRLRRAFFGLLDQTDKAAYVPFAPVVANLAVALESRASESCGFGFRQLGRGSWWRSQRTSGLATLAACVGERVLIGIGGAGVTRGGVTPGAVWTELGGLQPRHKPETKAERIEAWARLDQRVPGYQCWGEEVIETSRAVASDLCRFEAYAGPKGYALWSELDSAILRVDPGSRLVGGRPLGKADAQRLARMLEEIGHEEARALLNEHVGHDDPTCLTRPESKHLLALLEAWSGKGEGVSEESLLRIRGYQSRLGLSEVALTNLLQEAAGVGHLEEVRQAQVEGLIKRLREVEGESAGVAPAARVGPQLSGDWLDVPRVDEVLASALPTLPDLALQREIGSQWQGRVSLASRYADVAPITSEPSERWRAKLPGREPMLQLAASPLVVVGLSKKRTILLCPKTGSIRAELPRAGSAFFVGEVLVLTLARKKLAGFDPLTGETLWQTSCLTSWSRGQLCRDLFLTSSGPSLKAYRFDDPRSAPRGAWTAKADFAACYGEVRALGAVGQEDDFQPALLADRHLVIATARPNECVVLNTEGLPERVVAGQSPLLADGAGFVISPEYLNSEYRRPITVGAFEFETGKCLWELETLGLPVALTPESVYFIDRGRLVERSRRLGSVTSQTGDEVPVEAIRRDVFACRDVLLISRRHTQEIEAYAGGERLWTYATKKKTTAAHPPYPKLAPGFERLYALIGQREIVCLEPA